MKTNNIIFLLLFFLLAACGESDPVEHAGSNEPQPLSGLSITRAGGDVGLGNLADNSVLELTVKDATYTGNGDEKGGIYIYSNNQWTANLMNEEIRCANGQYPAYAQGLLNLTYANQATDIVLVHWAGSLETTLAQGTSTARSIPMQIATARIKVDVQGAYGEAPADLPDFRVSSSALRAGSFLIHPDNDYFQTPPTAVPNPFAPHPANWSLSDNEGYSRGDIAPQTIMAGTPFLTLTALGNTSEYGANEYTVTTPVNIELEAGKEYRFRIALSGGNQASILLQEITDFVPGGEVTAKNYRGISTEAELRQFAADWNKDPVAVLAKWEDAPGSNIIRLANDISITGTEPFEPIGTSEKPFTAIFDGGGHTISGISIDKSTEKYVGFFGTVNYGIIRGLHLRGAAIKAKGVVGGIAGYIHLHGTIIACSFSGTVEATEGLAGGIIGYNSPPSIISGCYSLATSIKAASHAYGISGSNSGSITGCHWLTGGSNQPARATDNAPNATISGCLSFDDATKLQTEAQYVNSMNNALYHLPVHKASPYSWLQIPGDNPLLMPTAPQLTLRKITTEAELRQFSDDWNANPAAALAKWEDYSGSGTIRLGADIYMSPALFTPIGNNGVNFKATFDGEGHTITGLKVNSNDNDAGLFGWVDEGVVCNLHLRQAEIKGPSFAGGIAGYNAGGNIIACSFGGTVESTGDLAGGIVGYSGNKPEHPGIIAGCYSIATKIETPINNGSGIAGYNNNSQINACHWLTGNGLPTIVSSEGIASSSFSFTGLDDFYNHSKGNLVDIMNGSISHYGINDYLWQQVTNDYPRLKAL